MNKPLKDWTLGEIAAECEKHAGYCKADACPLFTVDTEDCKIKEICRIYPRFWIFSEPPRWTEQEIKMAKAIKALWPDAEEVRARIEEYGKPVYLVFAGFTKLGVIYGCLFPTMKCGEDYALDEIIGGAE